MAKYTLTIADMDEGYCNRLFSYLTENEKKRFKVACFIQSSSLEEYLSNPGNKTDILLISQELYNTQFNYSNARVVIILSGGRIDASVQSKYAVNKYQPVDKLVEEILRAYHEENPDDTPVRNINHACKIVSFYSPATKCGKTVSVISACKALARHGKNVLYISLEAFPGYELFLPMKKKNAMADMLYFAKERKPNFVARFEELLEGQRNDAFRYLSPAISADDILNTDLETWEFVFEQLRGKSDFEYILVEYSSEYSKANLKKLGLSDKIMLVTSDEPTDLMRVNKMLETFKLSGTEIKFDAKILNKCNNNPNHTPSGFDRGIPFIPGLASFSDGVYEMREETVMGRILFDLIAGN